MSDSLNSDVATPPPRPERFSSKKELKDYVAKLHEYYAVMGRPRFGRSSPSVVRPLQHQQQQQLHEQHEQQLFQRQQAKRFNWLPDDSAAVDSGEHTNDYFRD